MIHGRSFKTALYSTAFSIGLVSMPTALAQDATEDPSADEKRLGVVTVSSLRRAEDTAIMDTPLAVSTISGVDLERSGVTSAFDAIALVPGVSTAKVGGQGAGVSIRGIAGAIGDSPVGYYLDDLPFTRVGQNVSPDLNPYDLASVEVLRGPQGTLYGLGSAGGTVRLLTQDPILDEFGGKLTLGYSDTEDGGENSKIQGALNVPIITDKVALRVSASQLDWGGFIDRPLEGREDFNEDENTSYRVKLRVAPTDNLDAVLSHWHSEDTTHNPFANDDLQRSAILSMSV